MKNVTAIRTEHLKKWGLVRTPRSNSEDGHDFIICNIPIIYEGWGVETVGGYRRQYVKRDQ